MVETNLTKCELGYQLTYHPVYRFAQFWTFSVSLLAIPAVFYFLFKRIFQLPFHGNLKFLLIFYFLFTLLFAFCLTIAFGYHFLIPFFIDSKCDLIIDVSLFKWVHIITLFLMTVPMVLPIGFSIERFVAMGMAQDYENSRTFLGPLLVFLLIAGDGNIIYEIYRNETFNDNFVSFILIPSSSAQQLNNFFWLLLYIEIANFSANCLLIIVYNRLKIRHLRKRSTLSVRYALEEISTSSKFTLIVSFTHLLFVCWYLISILFVRTMGQSFFNGYINYTVARGVYCAVPSYNLFVVFIGIKSLNYLNSTRHSRVQCTVQIKSTGREGARNYEDIITKHWDSVSSEVSSRIKI